MASTMRAEIADFIDTLNTDKARILESRYPEDELHEYADSAVPVYNRELAELLADDPGLATLDEPDLVPADADIWKRIQIAIYERLLQAGHEWLQEAKQEARDAEAEEQDEEDDDEPSDPVGRELMRIQRRDTASDADLRRQYHEGLNVLPGETRDQYVRRWRRERLAQDRHYLALGEKYDREHPDQRAPTTATRRAAPKPTRRATPRKPTGKPTRKR